MSLIKLISKSLVESTITNFICRIQDKPEEVAEAIYSEIDGTITPTSKARFIRRLIELETSRRLREQHAKEESFLYEIRK
jgi:hypothetical protein